MEQLEFHVDLRRMGRVDIDLRTLLSCIRGKVSLLYTTRALRGSAAFVSREFRIGSMRYLKIEISTSRDLEFPIQQRNHAILTYEVFPRPIQSLGTKKMTFVLRYYCTIPRITGAAVPTERNMIFPLPTPRTAIRSPPAGLKTLFFVVRNQKPH